MEVKAALDRLLAPADLTAAEMRALMRRILAGDTTPAQTAALLVALRAKGESVDEIAAAAEVLRKKAVRIEVAGDHLIDTCGTGGDGLDTFNVSTTAAFIVAAAGAQVAKHGNRSVSSRSGSADVLEAAGVNLDLTPQQVKRCIEAVGIGFLYAPQHHSALRQVAPVRRELGIRTLFNLLGPLLNPAGAPHQLLGVFAARYLEPLARVLGRLGSRHVLVVHADDALDEISLAAPTRVAELKHGQVRSYRIEPEQFGIPRSPLETIQVASVAESLEVMRRVLAGEAGPAADIVVLNAGAAIYAADLAPDLEAGIERARRLQRSGAGLKKLEALIDWSQRP
ncbi:anthranilate phosphoribosyltransferase [Methylomarinovum caldicuralii]|uniref:Anthranilate phosphoribosyltransferase n=1 Tax=Methylomarinovum caldicuralii TaxID=438856 RepID=A0AAU9C3F2_9GAMM|nr:anthranilate phosphoribosyltransferase [Methylomarinovum caldicuralii]BCX81684.1 anthranilate phosphoribosyltransferase [Methylomarinovum caldicuralii]